MGGQTGRTVGERGTGKETERGRGGEGAGGQQSFQK